ncbi:MAG TPA: hypothetical protein VEC57_05210 [Candidatus Limnocylindrales bacterium]|nr:hypothetical protein [Candidatus Limnocylindrales bacterium]
MPRISATFALLIVLAAAPASAATLASSPVSASPSDGCFIKISNLSDIRAAEIDLAFINPAGVTAYGGKIMVPPLGSFVGANFACADASHHWARMSGKFSSKQLRATYCVHPPATPNEAVCEVLR